MATFLLFLNIIFLSLNITNETWFLQGNARFLICVYCAVFVIAVSKTVKLIHILYTCTSETHRPPPLTAAPHLTLSSL